MKGTQMLAICIQFNQLQFYNLNLMELETLIVLITILI